MGNYSEKKIIDAWHKNVEPWTKAVRTGEIESRTLITNQAILTTIQQRNPRSVLDLGCGEGWLVREMHRIGIDALGIDVVEGLVSKAKAMGEGRFKCLNYEEVKQDIIQEKFDVLVCNFSLFGDESVKRLFKQVHSLLREKGAFIVQSLHPEVACGNEKYEDGWRAGSWVGFSSDFVDPAPWYFRTKVSWEKLFEQSGFALVDVLEPIHPKTALPASIIFVGEKTDL